MSACQAGETMCDAQSLPSSALTTCIRPSMASSCVLAGGISHPLSANSSVHANTTRKGQDYGPQCLVHAISYRVTPCPSRYSAGQRACCS
ncbi:hypothetical protein BC940DRAFT_41553 [Gongronella butleri]|nr:hypothetical protein BC940DRAFT_41553 [Gongronella butleri]